MNVLHFLKKTKNGWVENVIEELDERLNALAGYAQNIDEFTTTNYPAINQNVDNLKNRRTSLKGAVASGSEI